MDRKRKMFDRRFTNTFNIYTQGYFGHRSVEGGLLNGCPMGYLLYRFFKIKNYLFIQKLN